ncbi:interferon regulatory factor 4-like [Styela clava]
MATSNTAFKQKPNLKHWLYQQILSGDFRGLEWYGLNGYQYVFKLPWVKESDPDWNDYYMLFHKWAERDGKQSSDPQKAKRNFRSAINHSQHFEHLKNEDQQLQTGSFKVYRFLSEEEILAKKAVQQRNISEDSQDSNVTPSPVSVSHLGYNLSPAQVSQNHFLDEDPSCNNLTTPDLSLGQAFLELLEDPPPQFEPMNVSTSATNYVSQIHEAGNVQPTDDVQMPSIPSLDSEHYNSLSLEKLKAIGVTETDLRKCKFTIAYNDVDMLFREVEMDKLCNVVYGDTGSISALVNLYAYRQLPPQQIIQLQSHHDCQNLQIILTNMDTGILFGYDASDKSIYMIRHCKSHAFFFDVHKNDNEPVKVDRGIKYKIFSYMDFWNSLALSNWEKERGLSGTESTSIPAVSKVEIVVGCKPKHPNYGKGVRITLQPLAATRIKACENILPELQLSAEEASLDRQFAAMKMSAP